MHTMQHRLLPLLALFGFGIIVAPSAHAQAPQCEPAKLATKYPSLAGKTVRIGQDGESPALQHPRPERLQALDRAGRRPRPRGVRLRRRQAELSITLDNFA